MSARAAGPRFGGRALDQVKQRPLLSTAIAAALVFGVVVLIAAFLAPFQRSLINAMSFYALIAVSWNVMGGFTRLNSFGHTAMIGVGAYATAVTLPLFENWLMALLAGGTVGGIAAAVLIPAFRLKPVYFAIITLAFANALLEVATRLFPGGVSGLFVVSEKYLPNRTTVAATAVAVGVLMLCIVGVRMMTKSAFGERLEAVREDPDIAMSIGINPTSTRARAALVSGVIAGLAGGVYALTNPFISPESVFNVEFSITAVLATILGGAGTIIGPVIGGVIWYAIDVIIHQQTQDIAVSLLVYGGVLVGLAILLPHGIVGTISGRLKLRRKRTAPANGPDRSADDLPKAMSGEEVVADE